MLIGLAFIVILLLCLWYLIKRQIIKDFAINLSEMLIELLLFKSITIMAEIWAGTIVLYWFTNHILLQLAEEFNSGQIFNDAREIILVIIVIVIVLRSFIKLVKLFNKTYLERVIKDNLFNTIESFSMRFIAFFTTTIIAVLMLNYIYIPLFIGFVETASLLIQ